MASIVLDREPVGTTFPLYVQYEEFNDYPLANAFVPLTVLVLVFLAYVLKIGPAHMKNRPPYKLKYTILVYNAIQVIMSMAFVVMAARAMFAGGILPSKSPQFDPEVRKLMFTGMYYYFLGKLTELLDTIFFVLRKKDNQITFLHVYHHSSVIIGTWHLAFCGITMSSIYGAFINSLVHVVMYFYYFMAALGPQYQKYLTWKKYITTFQLVQFVSIVIHQVTSIVYTKGEHPVLSALYVGLSSMLFFKLFSDFYRSSYKPKAVTNGSINNEKAKAQ